MDWNIVKGKAAMLWQAFQHQIQRDTVCISSDQCGIITASRIIPLSSANSPAPALYKRQCVYRFNRLPVVVYSVSR
ncbi:MAG: hypothetical protein PHD43_18475 [Methylococcales bacterium]|nr:hypothetical protein [Methylococcales bacterium]